MWSALVYIMPVNDGHGSTTASAPYIIVPSAWTSWLNTIAGDWNIQQNKTGAAHDSYWTVIDYAVGTALPTPLV